MKKIFVIFCVLLSAGVSYGWVDLAISSGRMIEDQVPEVRLISPSGETVSVPKDGDLVFKWSPHERARGFRLYYDFRIYKGYQMYADSLIAKKQVDPGTYEIALPSSLFEDGQTYTWSMRQVYDSGRKSRRSYNSFKVMKSSGVGL